MTGISSGVVTTTTPVWCGVGEDLGHPARLVADQADLHEVVDRPGGRRAGPTMWPDGRGVDDHEVVVALPDLVADLADGEDLLHAGRGVGHEVERPGQRAEPGHQRAGARRAAGTRAASPRCSSPWPRSRRGPGRRLEAQRAGLEGRGQRALGVHLADQHPLARGCAARMASAAAIVVLPTPPLPVTKSSRRSSRSVGAAPDRRGQAPEAHPALAVGRPDLDVGDLRRGHQRPRGPGGR